MFVIDFDPMTGKRKRFSFLLDPRVIDEVLDVLAADEGDSRNRFLEKMLFNLGVEKGLLSRDTKKLGELRGGDRYGTKSDDEDEDEASDE